MIYLVWLTPPSIKLAGQLSVNKGFKVTSACETGQRMMGDLLLKQSKNTSDEPIAIVSPFVFNKAAIAGLKTLFKSGRFVFWYGGDAQSHNKAYKKLSSLFSKDMDSGRFVLDQRAYSSVSTDLISYIRFKISQGFFGDETNRFNRKFFKETIERIGKAFKKRTSPQNSEDPVPSDCKFQVKQFEKMSFPAMAGESEPMRTLKREVKRIGESGISNVLLLGETGSGKEACAFFLHINDASRSKKKFGVINCASLNRELLISRLFGHKRGSFTGATANQKGMIEVHNGGTIFLDELPDMPLEVQAMLLRFLQSGNYRGIGATTEVEANVKIVASAQPDLLQQKITEGTFRKDLYYRLAGKIISVPPLKEITEDIPVIVDDIVYRLEQDIVKRNETIQYFKSLKKQMDAYHWPGNVRELANYIKRRLHLGKDENIVLGDVEIGNYASTSEDSTSIGTTSNGTTTSSGTTTSIGTTTSSGTSISSNYGIPVSFGSIAASATSKNIKDGSVIFESVESVKNRYMKHVLKVLQEKGVSQVAVAGLLNVSKNTLTKGSKNK